jgi:hypothetical protein
MRAFALLLVLMMVMPLTGTSLAQDAMPPLAAITDGNLTLYGVQGAPITVDTTIEFYSELTWSPDGQVLAYTGFDSNGTALLKITDASGSAPRILSENLSISFPPTFTADGQRLIYVIGTNEPVGENTPDVWVQFVVQGLMPGASPEFLARAPYGLGCGGGSSVPADFAYAAEGGGHLGYQHILETVPGGIVYSRDCVPQSTTMVNTTNGDLITLAEPVTQAVISPDHGLIAGIPFDNQRNPVSEVAIVGLGVQYSERMPTAHAVERVFWNASGDALYYTWREESGSVPATEAISTAMGMEIDQIALHQSGVSRISLVDGSETDLYSASAYAIGRVIQTPDPNVILFSVVPSLDAWLNAINSGVAAPDDTLPTYFAVQLYQLSLSDGAVTLLGDNLLQATLNKARFLQ